MKQKIYAIATLVVLMAYGFEVSAQGNHVFAPSESVIWGDVSLNTPAVSQTWSTERTATPGYFSAVGVAAYINASDAYNIDGYVKHYADAANQSYTFPVGVGSVSGYAFDLRTLTTSGTIPATAEYATAWIPGDPGISTKDLTSTGAAAGAHPTTSFASPIQSVSTVGQWDWQALSADAGAGVTITVSIPDLTTLYPGVSASLLRLVGWNGTKWVDLSGLATASGVTENSTLSGTMISGITAIGIGATTTILPLELISFNTTANNCSPVLTWITANEINTLEFNIEASADGNKFTKIGTVAAQGFGGRTYTFSPVQAKGTTYYRLKMVDKDGKYTYSDIKALTLNCNADKFITVYPNPVTTGSGEVTLRFNVPYKGKAIIVFTNVLGQQFVRKAITITDGVNTNSFNTGMLAPDTYFIRVLGEDGKPVAETIKIIKQK